MAKWIYKQQVEHLKAKRREENEERETGAEEGNDKQMLLRFVAFPKLLMHTSKEAI
jgi:hypothetical protein